MKRKLKIKKYPEGGPFSRGIPGLNPMDSFLPTQSEEEEKLFTIDPLKKKNQAGVRDDTNLLDGAESIDDLMYKPPNFNLENNPFGVGGDQLLYASAGLNLISKGVDRARTRKQLAKQGQRRPSTHYSYTYRYGDSSPMLKEGGEIELDETEIQRLQNEGYELEFLD